MSQSWDDSQLYAPYNLNYPLFWSQILVLRYKTLKQILGGFYMRQTSSNFYPLLIFPAQTLKECEM